MHEMSTVARIIEKAGQAAKEYPSGRIRAITVDVGEMTDVLPYYIEKYYCQAVCGTFLEGSEITVNSVPVQTKCEECGEVYHPESKNNYACPLCGCTRGKLLSGRQVELRDISFEE